MAKKYKSHRKGKRKEEYLQSIFDDNSPRKKNKKSKKFSLKDLTPSYTKKSRSKTRAVENVSAFPKPEEEDFVPVTARQIKDRNKVEKTAGKVVVDVLDRDSLSQKTMRIILIVLIALIFVLALLILSFMVRDYFIDLGRSLETNENIKSAVIKGDTLYITLADADLTKLKQVRFVFLGDKEYYKETSVISTNYKFKSSDIGIKSLDKLEKVSAVFLS